MNEMADLTQAPQQSESGDQARRNGQAVTCSKVAEASSQYLSQAASNATPASHDCPPGYKRTEVGVIPEDWEAKTVRELGSVYTGGTPPTTTSKYWNGDIPWVTPTDISDQKNIYVSERKLSREGLKKIRALPADTILVTCIASIGKNAILRRAGSCNQQINAVVPDEDVNVDFLFYAIELASERLKLSAGVTATPIVSKALFENFQVIIPYSTEEQSAIANALSDVDTLISELEKLIAKKQAIKTATMQQLLTGRTRLPQFALREDGTPKGYKQSELGEIPEDWDVQPLSKLSTYINDGTHHTPTYTKDGIPFYSVENVSANDFYNVKYISEEEHKKLIKRCKPEKGDILMTRIGTLGVTRVIDWEVDASIYVSLALIKLRQEVRPEYVYSFSKSSIFNEEVEKRSLVNATPQKINMVEIGQIPILFPKDDEEQTAIATILSDMDAEIQALQQRLAKTRQIKQGMMQELLTGKTRLVKPKQEVA